MEVYEDGITNQNIYLFSARVIHKTVANKMKGTPVSAGFVSKNKETGELFCVGSSDSLRLGSRVEDNVLLRSMFL
jgi:hypothetical protein